MDSIRLWTTFVNIIFLCCITQIVSIQKREWLDTTATLPEGDMSCFSEYMEMGVHTSSVEGLRVWLSEALHTPGNNMTSLDQLTLKMSACGFTLYKDMDRNFLLRVSYSGCLVQQQEGYYVLMLNLMKRVNRFGRSFQSLVMKCPEVSVQDREHIQCDPEYIQVTRQVPYDNWNNKLPWLLSLSNQIIVALEDASLIQMNADMTGANITVQGRRSEVLSPVKVLGYDVEFLALKLVSGHYAYSVEATCPKVTEPTAEETMLHIYKRRMGLTKRGSSVTEALTVSNVSVNQTENFTLHQTSQFVTIIIPTAQILQRRSCPDNKQMWQPWYRADVVLTFRETNHTMHWSMENTLPCTEPSKLNFKENVPFEHHSLNNSTFSKQMTQTEVTTAEMSQSPHTQTSSFNVTTEQRQLGSGYMSFEFVNVTDIALNGSDFHNVTNSLQDL